MTKYFDKLLKIKILYYLLPITWKHENKMPFWGMWMFSEIHWISL